MRNSEGFIQHILNENFYCAEEENMLKKTAEKYQEKIS